MIRINTLKIFEPIIVIGLIALSVYIFTQNSITIPSRYGTPPDPIERPGTYFVGGLPLCFAFSIVLFHNSSANKNLAKILFGLGFVSFFIAAVIDLFNITF